MNFTIYHCPFCSDWERMKNEKQKKGKKGEKGKHEKYEIKE